MVVRGNWRYKPEGSQEKATQTGVWWKILEDNGRLVVIPKGDVMVTLLTMAPVNFIPDGTTYVFCLPLRKSTLGIDRLKIGDLT